MSPVTRQEVQSLLDQTKNRITERMANRQDFQCLQDLIKNMYSALQQNQQLLRQGELQRAQIVRRSMVVEARIAQMEHEIKSLQQTILRLMDSRPEKIVLPARPEENQRYGQYVYRPA